jgi:hypothetical protein
MGAPLSFHFVNVIKSIPLQKRKELAAHIDILCSHFQIENNFLVNQLSVNAEKRHAKISATAAAKKQHMPRYWVWVEGYTAPKPCTLAEAAKLMGVAEITLQVRVSSGRHFEREIISPPSFKSSDRVDGLYICSKMTQEELDQQLELFNTQFQQGLFAKPDIQSVSPTRP